jgi:FkbM family methyltransferase
VNDPFVSYAQNHEDVVLARALRPDTASGFWIDVGAADPVVDSVTAAFSERGWRGINVEPLHAEHERLCAERPHDTNLRVAIGAKPGVAMLFEGPPENRGASTLVPGLAERYLADGQAFEPVEVEVMTLADVVAAHAHDVVDFLKIDVEGSERAVLEGADWSTFRPRIVVIEATEPNSTRPTFEEWEPILLDEGYCFALFDGLNRFYVPGDEPDLMAALSAPASVLDNFIPYAWEDQVRRSTIAARHGADSAAIAFEECSVLRDDLDAAQRLNAQALDELGAAQRDATNARSEYETLAAQHAALLDTRLYRFTAPIRRLYGRVRHRH